jgi:hypothetical protein
MVMQPILDKTIKAVVFDIIRQTSGLTDYETVTKAVLEQKPESAWKKSHWHYYRNQITSEKGKFKDEFSDEIKANLRRGTRGSSVRTRGVGKIIMEKTGTETREDKVKRIGDEVLEHARFVIALAAKDDAQMYFKLRRWVYQRLLQEEIREKRPIKQALWDSGIRACQKCGDGFRTIKGVEIHRKNADEVYSVENCQLLCRKCHQEPM